jgi:hypothetical protein
MTPFLDNSDDANALRAAHLASGRPRYSVSIFAGGVRTEPWIDDRDAASAEHNRAAAREEVECVLTFDNYGLDMIAIYFSDGWKPAAERDAARDPELAEA